LATPFINQQRRALTPPKPSFQTALLRYWLPALLWIFAIALFSTGTFGSDHTSSVMARVLRLLHIHLSSRQFDFLHGVVRKCAHFTVYGILSGLFFRAFRGTHPSPRRWQISWAAFALGISLVVASADEMHQVFTAGRTGTWKDVFLDMIGAMFVQTIIVVFTAGNRNRMMPPGSLTGRTADTIANDAEQPGAFSVTARRHLEDSGI
jgi:VanZ family protein